MGDPTHVVDKQQRPIQNTYRDDVERFHRLGTQLRLDLEESLNPDLPAGTHEPPGPSEFSDQAA